MYCSAGVIMSAGAKWQICYRYLITDKQVTGNGKATVIVLILGKSIVILNLGQSGYTFLHPKALLIAICNESVTVLKNTSISSKQRLHP